MIEIASIREGFPPELRDRLKCTWGGTTRMTGGVVHTLESLSGFVAIDEMTGRLAGAALYKIFGTTCEMIIHESIFPRKGIGTRLLEQVLKGCDSSGITKIQLVVTNDNVGAMRYYQKRGFNLSELRPEGYKKMRESHPELPKYGYDGIEISHELIFEMKLDGSRNWERFLIR